MKHPCQYSPEVLEIVADMIQPGMRVHDPFAGPGNRLAALCDKIGATFSGTDIEAWPGSDPRVKQRNAKRFWAYPPGDDYLLVTSPVYVNKRCADYRNGPGPNTKVKGRRDYGIALGRALDPENLARHTGRPAEVEAYWALHGEAVQWWPLTVVVNVDLPIAERWEKLLDWHGYTVMEVVPAYTRRYGGLDNAEKRAEHEVVMRAER